MQSNLSQFTEDFNSSSKTFTETTQKLGDQSATSGGQFKIGIGTLKNVMTSAMKGGSAKFFGNDTGFGIFLTVIGVIVAWIGILYGWKAWKGNPD